MIHMIHIGLTVWNGGLAMSGGLTVYTGGITINKGGLVVTDGITGDY
jgi:hypothetical protein